MLETRQGAKYISAFHEKHPNSVCIESQVKIFSFSDLNEHATWGKENLNHDALIVFKKRSDDFSAGEFLLWFLTDETDAMAVKLRWT